MPNRIFTIKKDTEVALYQAGSQELGAGAATRLHVGVNGDADGFGNDLTSRVLLDFNDDFSGMLAITSARLHIRTNVAATDSDPDFLIRRITSSWPEGTKTSLDPANATHWGNQPSTTATNETPFDVTPLDHTWDAVNITALMQDAMAAGFFYGLRLTMDPESAASGWVTFYPKEVGGSEPYIDVDYTTNSAPNAPTNVLVAGVGSHSVISSQSPTITFTHSDPDADPPASYDIQIDATSGDSVVPDWVSPVVDAVNQVGGISGNDITYAVGVSLTRGQWYAMRCRTADTLNGDGAWSTVFYFRIASLPTASVTVPANGHTAKMAYTAGAGGVPQLAVEWSYADADGHAQTGVAIKVYSDSAGSPGAQFGTTYNYSGAGTSASIPLANVTPVNGTYYHISVTPTCSLSLTGNESTKNRCRARWGRASYYYATGVVPVGYLSPSFVNTVPSNTAMVIEYALTTSSAEPSTWYATLAEISIPGSANFIWHRVTIMGWGSATPTSPALQSITFQYQTSGLVADNWTLPSQGSIDEAVFVYGTQALKMTCDGTNTWTYQTVTGLIVGQTYILSGRIKSLGNSGARIAVYSSDGTTQIATTTTVVATQDFGQLDAAGNDVSKMSSPSFVASADTVTVRCSVNGAASTYAWFDALKLEQSSVVTPWTPGFIGRGVAIDAGGVQVDASAGGVFRVRGTLGGSNVTDTGPLGLRFATGLDVKNTTAPASPPSGYLRVYASSVDKHLHQIDDAGTDTDLASGGGGGGSGGPAVFMSTASIPFTDGDTFKRVSVVDASIAATSKINGSIRRPDTLDADDPGWVYIANILRVYTGGFDLLIVATDAGSVPGDDAPYIAPNETVTYVYGVQVSTYASSAMRVFAHERFR